MNGWQCHHLQPLLLRAGCAQRNIFSSSSVFLFLNNYCADKISPFVTLLRRSSSSNQSFQSLRRLTTGRDDKNIAHQVTMVITATS